MQGPPGSPGDVGPRGRNGDAVSRARSRARASARAKARTRTIGLEPGPGLGPESVGL